MSFSAHQTCPTHLHSAHLGLASGPLHLLLSLLSLLFQSPKAGFFISTKVVPPSGELP